MITELLITLVVTIPAWILANLPTVTFPTYLTSTGSDSLYASVQSAKASLYQIGYWLPVAQLELALGLVLAALLAGVGVKGFRIVASFLTLGGGSAA